MTDNESMREGEDRYCGAGKNRDEAGEQGGYSREACPEEYRGGYDPGFLTGGDGDGYRRMGKGRNGYCGGVRSDQLGGYDRERFRGKYRGGYDPGFLG